MPHHSALVQHDPALLIRDLKEGKNEGINAVNAKEHYLTQLQIAAREGLIEPLLWLLYAGANMELAIEAPYKTPLYLALERGHLRAARILYACHANYHHVEEVARRLNDQTVLWNLDLLEPNVEITRSLLFWAVTHYRPFYGDAFIRTHAASVKLAQDVSGLIELAAEQNNAEVVKALLKVGKVRADSLIPTAGYWAAVHNNDEIYHLVCKENNAVSRTLQQLLNDRRTKEYEIRRKMASHQVQEDVFISPPDKKLQPRKVVRDFIIYNDKLKVLYASQDYEELNAPEKYCDMISEMIKQANYVPLNKLLPYLLPEPLFIQALQNRPDLLLFLLNAYPLDYFPMALEHVRDKRDILTEERESIQHQLISRRVNNFFPVPEEEEQMFNILLESAVDKEENTLLTQLILRCLSDRSRANKNKLIQLASNKKVKFSTLFDQPEVCDPPFISFLNSHFKRFGLSQKQVNKKWHASFSSVINRDIYTTHIVPCLHGKDIARTIRVSRFFHHAMQSKEKQKFLKSSHAYQLNLQQLKRQHQAITNYYTELDGGFRCSRRIGIGVAISFLLFTTGIPSVAFALGGLLAEEFFGLCIALLPIAISALGALIGVGCCTDNTCFDDFTINELSQSTQNAANHMHAVNNARFNQINPTLNIQTLTTGEIRNRTQPMQTQIQREIAACDNQIAQLNTQQGKPHKKEEAKAYGRPQSGLALFKNEKVGTLRSAHPTSLSNPATMPVVPRFHTFQS